MISLEIPTPTSTNRLQRSTATGRRYSSREYEAWKAAAGGEIMAQRPKLARRSLPAGAPYVAILFVSAADRGDRDNRMKAALDLLSAMGITPDDKFNEKGGYAAAGDLKPGRCRICVWPILGPGDEVVTF